jgi:hypothetical protein
MLTPERRDNLESHPSVLAFRTECAARGIAHPKQEAPGRVEMVVPLSPGRACVSSLDVWHLIGTPVARVGALVEEMRAAAMFAPTHSPQDVPGAPETAPDMPRTAPAVPGAAGAAE